MDPITAAILAGIAAGAASGAADAVTTQAVTGAYHALKQLLAKKFGDHSDVVHAVQDVETKPDSSARKGVLKEEIAATDAARDAELVTAARALLDKIDALPNGSQILQSVTGDANIVIHGSGNVVTYYQAPSAEKKT